LDSDLPNTTALSPQMRPALTSILNTIDHPRLFALWFKQPETWRAQRAFLSAAGTDDPGSALAFLAA